MYFRKKKTRAQAMVEFSLVAGIFFVLILGFVEFARYIHAKYTIIEAARVGAETLAKADDSKSAEELQKLLRDVVINNAASIEENRITSISYKVIEINGAQFIQVSVDYDVPTITPLSTLYRLLGAKATSNGETVFSVRAVVTAKKESIATKVCPNCGITLPASAKFCPNCGTKL